MANDRYVVLGLARVRTSWFSDVGRWASSGAVAVDFVKTVSVEEVKARLGGGRPFSALLVDAGVPGIDRDLLALAAEHGCATVVVSDGHDGRSWDALGANALLPPDFGRSELEATLAGVAVPIGNAADIPGAMPSPLHRTGGYRGRTVAVTGAGGTGASTVAMALSRGLASDPASADNVVLADLRLHAEAAVLHDVRDVIPGILELVEAHRAGTPSVREVRGLTFTIAHSNYHLLLGLRRHRDWTAIRPRALHASLDGLRRSFRLVVADIGADFEGEDLTGSADVEDRNLLARATLGLADVVVAVGTPGIKGLHGLLRVIRDLVDNGVEPERVVPVINRAPRRTPARAELARAMTDLLQRSGGVEGVLSPIFIPERRGIDAIVRDGLPIPSGIADPVTAAVRSRIEVLAERAPTRPTADEGVAIAPGSLGTWADEAAG